MLEIARFTGSSGWIGLDFMERDRTPERATKLGIRMHVAKLSLSDTILSFDISDACRSREAVHDWVRKADLQPNNGKSLDQTVVDETMIRIND